MTAQQQFEQGKLLGGQVDALAVALDPAADQVQAQVGKAQAGFLGRAAAATQQAAHPCQQLGEGKRLDQVIIGAQLQAMHAVFYGIAGGEEQHRHLTASCAYGLENLPAIAAGQHHIEDQQVVVAGQGQVLAGIAVGGQLRGKACFTEALAQVLAGLGLVFDDQQFHQGGSWTWVAGWLYRAGGARWPS
ncbi:hypothetical protein D3C77_314740 [compost metagenome]